MSAFTDKAKQIIASVAPTLGVAIGGPFGALASVLINGALGGNAKAAEAAILSGDPDALLKLKQAEIDFKLKTQELGIQEEQLAADDRASARAREIAIKDLTPRNLAYLFTLGFFSTLAAQFYIAIEKIAVDPNSMQLLNITTGVLFTLMIGCKEYYFGSSAGSDKKTDALSEIAKMP